MNHPQYEKTLVIIKPDGVQRSLIGELIKRYERIGLKLVGSKMLIPSKEMVESHYTVDPEWKRKAGEKVIKNYEVKGLMPPSLDPLVASEKILGRLKKYMSSGPVVALVWQGAHSVAIVRKITGGTEPLTSDIGTIRGDFVLDSYELSDTDTRSVRNLVHASGTVDEAEKEINLWFRPEEILSYRLVQDEILYDVNLDGILE
ncbi:MAG: nucleoside-diphosphate kinase [Candidatus Zambryskibacteria bacterium]|nr:nucleoside-diphosphate kinase [Candidatus Zambryskibacteria bacterium]